MCNKTVTFRKCTNCATTKDEKTKNNSCRGCMIGASVFNHIAGTCENCELFKQHCISCELFEYETSRDIDKYFLCYKCERPYVLENNNCVCPGYKASNNSCIPCQVGCIRCDGMTCL